MQLCSWSSSQQTQIRSVWFSQVKGQQICKEKSTASYYRGFEDLEKKGLAGRAHARKLLVVPRRHLLDLVLMACGKDSADESRPRYDVLFCTAATRQLGLEYLQVISWIGCCIRTDVSRFWPN
jgi:hypothetical protein